MSEDQTDLQKGASTRLAFEAEVDKRVLRCLRDALEGKDTGDEELKSLRSQVKTMVWESLRRAQAEHDHYLRAAQAQLEQQRRQLQQRLYEQSYTQGSSSDTMSKSPQTLTGGVFKSLFGK